MTRWLAGALLAIQMFWPCAVAAEQGQTPSRAAAPGQATVAPSDKDRDVIELLELLELMALLRDMEILANLEEEKK